jgi:hypothetical protein
MNKHLINDGEDEKQESSAQSSQQSNRSELGEPPINSSTITSIEKGA